MLSQEIKKRDEMSIKILTRAYEQDGKRIVKQSNVQKIRESFLVLFDLEEKKETPRDAFRDKYLNKKKEGRNVMMLESLVNDLVLTLDLKMGHIQVSFSNEQIGKEKLGDVNLDSLSLNVSKQGKEFSANVCGLRINSHYIFTQVVSGGLDIFNQSKHWFLTMKSKSYGDMQYEEAIKKVDDIRQHFTGYTEPQRRKALEAVQKSTKKKAEKERQGL